MSARDDLYDQITGQYENGAPAQIQRWTTRKLDALEAEAAAQRDNQITDWLLKKAREYRSTGSTQHRIQAEAIESVADKISRGAVS